jgi:hypothetical protein
MVNSSWLIVCPSCSELMVCRHPTCFPTHVRGLVYVAPRNCMRPSTVGHPRIVSCVGVHVEVPVCKGVCLQPAFIM